MTSARAYLWLISLISIFAAPSVSASTVDLRSIEFQSGHPFAGESMESAVKPPSEDEYQLLRNNLDIFRSVPSYTIEVVGYADSNECSHQECSELSLRRAQCVYDWLIAQGIPADRVIGPKAQGAGEPIDDNSTDDGRQRNRRTEIHMVAPKDVPAAGPSA